MPKEIETECKLWILQRGGQVRMTPFCERSEVRLGFQKCAHFKGEPSERVTSAKDITVTCRRVKGVRQLPSIEDRLPKKS